MADSPAPAPAPHDHTPEALLPDDLLDRIRDRAPAIDAENRFVDEDLAELSEVGYTRLLVPTELGGLGGSILDATRSQRRLAQAAPATALAVNMHLVVTGAAMLAHRRGVESVRDILTDAAAGELFAFGISEAGNDAMLFDSGTVAEPDGDGGHLLRGTKIFTSLSPGWTRLLVHAREERDGQEPRLVFGVIDRTEQVRSRDDWDTHGMRGTQSCTTVLEGAPLAAERIVRTTGIGPNPDPVVFGIFGAFELLLASVYTGVAERAIVLGAAGARTRISRSTGAPHSDDPDTRRRIADAAIRVDGAILQIERLTADLDAFGAEVPVAGTVDHGARWFLHFSGVKSRAGEAAVAAVDQVLRASGGRHFFRSSELERISRDVRAVLYHPSDEESVHRSYAKALLGEIGEDATDSATRA